jgi:hypothetical protein
VNINILDYVPAAALDTKFANDERNPQFGHETLLK